MFKNEPFTDFSQSENRERWTAALADLDREISRSPRVIRPISGGEEISTGSSIARVDPSAHSVTLGQIHLASASDAERALRELSAARSGWEGTPFTERAAILRRAAQIMREKRAAIGALVIREAAKPWGDTDVEIAEAIDFCEYYADEMLRLGPPLPTSDTAAEENCYFYQPRGIVAVIAPWNFPFAIAAGMVVAALVTGNTVAFKPAEQSSLIGKELVDILYQAGIPKSALSFLPGIGEEVGRTLVASPLTDMICFTGSKNVGLEIIATAGRTDPAQRNVKRVVAEMGGKNAIIVDSDADLDEAVKWSIFSAFGYAGQKCSACSRLLAVGDVYEELLSRLAAATGDLIAGPTAHPGTFLGPVIDEEAHQRILRTIAEGEKTNRLHFKSSVPAGGYFVPATIFRDVDPSSPLWREEIFGPVLAVAQVADFGAALEEANRSQYGLTGGVFSRSPSNIERAKREFRVGNLYINRKITGALVFRQPFGGAKMSGVGSKAGGPDYLIQFMEPRVITENVMRRGMPGR